MTTELSQLCWLKEEELAIFQCGFVWLISVWGEMAPVLWEVLLLVPYSCSVKSWGEGILVSETPEGRDTHPSALGEENSAAVRNMFEAI